jgi:hypothetical protein
MMLSQITYTRPRLKVGKIVSKYLIIEILAYAQDDYQDICRYLFDCSRSLRFLLTSTYNELKLMVLETHNVTIEATLPLTFNPKTSHSAHALLDKIFNAECKKA